jgi:hypothetical protein
MKNLENEIKYHKVISEARAELMFDEVLEPYVNTINMPDGNQWYKTSDNRLEYRSTEPEIIVEDIETE